jgi:hypothetical protein
MHEMLGSAQFAMAACYCKRADVMQHPYMQACTVHQSAAVHSLWWWYATCIATASKCNAVTNGIIVRSRCMWRRPVGCTAVSVRTAVPIMQGPACGGPKCGVCPICDIHGAPGHADTVYGSAGRLPAGSRTSRV